MSGSETGLNGYSLNRRSPLPFLERNGSSGGCAGVSRHQAASGSMETGFTPHVIMVPVGEDVASKIMSFCRNGRRNICILSAYGALSNVTLQQASTHVGFVMFEGYFQILSLSGSIMLSNSGGHITRICALSVSLAGSEFQVLGGGVAGPLVAASPVQVIVGSFIADSQRESYVARSPSPHGTQNESSGSPRKPPDQNTPA